MKRPFYDIFIIFLLTANIIFSQDKPQRSGFIKDINSNVLNREPVKTDSKFRPSIQTNINSTLTSTSTVIFEEDFEGTTGFPPSGWKTVNKDGGGATGPWFQGSTSVFTAYNGNGYAAANYQGANDFYIDEWLISPRILSIGSNDTLIFWHRSPDYSSWNDSIQVRISTTDTAITSFTIIVDYFKTSTTGWAQKRYQLKNYVPSGSNIYIAFRYLLFDGGPSGTNSDYVGLDLVQIKRPQVAKDIKVVSIDFPYSNSKMVIGETIDLLVTFQNVGSSSQTNIPVRLRITSPNGTTTEYNQTISSLTPNQSRQLVMGIYTPMQSGIYSVRAYSLLSGDQNTFNDSLSSSFRGAVLLEGTFTIGTAGDIPSLKKAIDTLNNNLIFGNITYLLIDPIYNEPPLAIGPLDYSYLTTKILIKPKHLISPTININSTPSEPYGIAIRGSSKITIDGANSEYEQRNTSLNVNGKIGILICGTEEANADSNVIKNLRIRTSADSLYSSSDFYGIQLCGYSLFYKDVGNRISNCDISKHGSVGIASQWQNGLIIENNFIHDWTQINGDNDVHGIWLAEGTINAVVRANVIGNIENRVNHYWAYGIENSAGSGSNALIYNNMIYNILASGSGINVNYSRGIFSSNISNNGDGYYYNSIYLCGTDNSTSPLSYTTGFEFFGGSNITLKNNIVFNESILSGTSENNKAYCVYIRSTPTNFVSDNNDFYAPNHLGMIGYNTGNRKTLVEWRASFSPMQDINSISVNPLFVSPTSGNLHIQTSDSSHVNAAGTPIVGINTDIDGNLRHPITPDIGADEFTPGLTILSMFYLAGWNLISLPLVVPDNRRQVLFPTATSEAFSYNGGYVLNFTLENGKGYWLKFSSSQNIDIAGLPIATDTINVQSKWNMIGPFTYPIAANSIIQVPEGNIISKFYSYNGRYLEADTLKPGIGYWVKVRQNGKLILNP